MHAEALHLIECDGAQGIHKGDGLLLRIALPKGISAKVVTCAERMGCAHFEVDKQTVVAWTWVDVAIAQCRLVGRFNTITPTVQLAGIAHVESIGLTFHLAAEGIGCDIGVNLHEIGRLVPLNIACATAVVAGISPHYRMLAQPLIGRSIEASGCKSASHLCDKGLVGILIDERCLHFGVRTVISSHGQRRVSIDFKSLIVVP